MSMNNIIFAETQAEIDGEVDHFVKVGSTLRLTCRVYLGDAGPDAFYAKHAVIHWFHDKRLLDPDLENWKNSRVIAKGSKNKAGTIADILDTTNSSLKVGFINLPNDSYRDILKDNLYFVLYAL